MCPLRNFLALLCNHHLRGVHPLKGGSFRTRYCTRYVNLRPIDLGKDYISEMLLKGQIKNVQDKDVKHKIQEI